MVSHSFVAPWTVAHQAPLSMEFPTENTTVGFQSLLQGTFLTQGSNPCLLHWQVDSLPWATLFIVHDTQWKSKWVSELQLLFYDSKDGSVNSKIFIGSRIYGNMCCKKLGLILQAIENH